MYIFWHFFFFTKPSFDPEDGWFGSWKPTFLESTRKTGLATWGSKLACGHSKGSKKWFSPPCGGVLAHDKVTKPILDPEDGRFSSWKQTFFESTRKTGLTTWGSELARGHSKGSKNGFCPPVGGGEPWKVKNDFWPWKQWGNLPLLILSTGLALVFEFMAPKQF